MSASAIRLLDVHVEFPGRPGHGLSGVDLEVGTGEQLLVTGASGGGKSTLLHTLTGVVPQSVLAEVGGIVDVLGRDPRVEPVARLALDVGWLGQDPASNTCLPTVEDEVALPLENRGVPREQIGPRVRRALEDVGASHLSGRRVSAMSGGEQQRVALAAVLVGEPEVLLLDEPTAMLDPVAARSVLGLLGRVTRGRTALLVEHGGRLGTWCPARTVVVEGGRVVADGPTSQQPDGPDLPARPRRRRERGEVALELRGATFLQGGREVVRGVDVTFRRGQVTVVLGVNGSGKSSLLLGAAGLLQGDVPAGADDVAVVFQRPEQQVVARTVLGEVGRGPDAAALLARFGLDGLGHVDPYRLSGGQQRRLSIAAMTALRRGVLLLDEPTSGLDPAQTHVVVDLVRDLADRGVAVGLVTHDLALARALADDVVVLRDGVVVASGDAELLDDDDVLAGAGLLATDEGVAPGVTCEVVR